MNPAIDHEKYAEWDGAYVLGALSASERAEYEAHLDACPQCRDAVADFAALPGLLGAVSPADAFAMLEPDAASAADPTDAAAAPELVTAAAAPPAALVPALAHRVRRRRRTRNWVTGGIGLLAAAALAAAFVVPRLSDGHGGGTAPAPVAAEAFPLAAPSVARDIPGLTADVTLTPHGSGTTVTMTCDYAATQVGGGALPPAYELALYVDDAQGNEVQVSSWPTQPYGGSHRYTVTSTVPLTRAQIAHVEIRDTGTNAVLLEGHP